MAEKTRTITVALEEPVTHGETTYTELTFERRKAKHLVAMDLVKGATRKHMALLAAMANVPLPVIEELDADDFDRVAEETVAVMGKSAMKALQDAQSRAATEGALH